MRYEAIFVETNEGVTKITMNLPDKLNALSVRLLGELREAMAEAAEDRACRCVLLTGAGRGFSSGADLTDTGADLTSGEMPDFGALLEQRYHPIIESMRGMHKPVIAAINGSAAGAGCNIGLAADIVIAARSAKFIQAFVRIGLVPDAGGSWTIPRLIGRQRALQWMMSGEVLDAETAERWGLIAAVHDDDALAAAADTLAAHMAGQPTQALAGIKRLVDASSGHSLDEQMAMEAATQRQVGRSNDTVEGIMAFVHKRQAHFTGD